MVSQALRPLVLEALSRALEPVVLLLLKCGVTWKDFSDLAKEKYVKVATEAFGIRGRPTNISRVAILSGLGRREVTRLRRAPTEQAIKQGFVSKPAQVLQAWYHDERFLDSSGRPKDLEPEGADDSFAELVRRYAPGMPPVAMMKELRAAGAIGDAEGNRLRVLKRSYIPRELNENLIRLWGSVLQDVGTTFEHNISRDDADPPRFERRAISLRVDASALPEFRELLEREGQAFLERIDEWITAHEVGVGPEDQRKGIRLGIGLYHIQDQALPLTRKRNLGVARTRGDTMS
jgi:hypothetical protein